MTDNFNNYRDINKRSEGFPPHFFYIIKRDSNQNVFIL